MQKPVKLIAYSSLKDRKPVYAEVKGLDLVIVRFDDKISVLYGRCLHRGALLADGYIDGDNLICGVHNWDYRYDTGVSEYNDEEPLYKFSSEIKDNIVWIDEAEIDGFLKSHPQPFNRDQYLRKYADTHPENTEPYTNYIKELAQNGLKNIGHHGFTEAMVWKGMSFGALSREAKISLARGAELAGTGIASGEGGMLPEEQTENSRYLYEMASAKFGFSWGNVKRAQAFHFKGGQGAKTGTGGHLPGSKVTEEIAKVRGLKPGEAAISPPAFPDLISVKDFRTFADEVRERTGGIPVGFKIAASHIEKDIDFALEAGADYIILDGRGGGTGAAPTILRNNINVPTIPALARACGYDDFRKSKKEDLVTFNYELHRLTGINYAGLRT